jgi:hypothetical protein
MVLELVLFQHISSQFYSSLLLVVLLLVFIALSHTYIFQNYFNTNHNIIIQVLLAYTKKFLSTRSLATYVLTTSGHDYLLSAEHFNKNGHGGKVLLLGGHGGEDYVKDMLIHGIKKQQKWGDHLYCDFLNVE